MRAPSRFIDWLSRQEFSDRKALLPPGLKLQYHSRSDEHSKKLGEFIVDDLLDACPLLRHHAASGRVAYGINCRFRWPTGKEKTLDLALGVPATPMSPPLLGRIHRVASKPRSPAFSRVLIACEEKAVMTEHGKSQPRIFSELNDAHVIVHEGSRFAVAVGISMVNIASTFISPLRQRRDKDPVISHHNQPHVAQRMVQHLRRLPLRNDVDDVGFEAYCTFVVNVDNQGHTSLYTEPPAPQPGDPDHYETFLSRICEFYSARFPDPDHLPADDGLSIEAALQSLAAQYPGLFRKVAELVVTEGLEGAAELYAVLESLESQEQQ